MIRNQRPYQWMYSKTGNDLLSLVTAFCAKALGIAYCEVSSLFGKETVEPGDPTALYQALSKICPKPESDMNFPPLPLHSDIDVSVIVPAHNAEKYLSPCLDSILSQKTSYRIQLIVVNDRSTDGTSDILEAYRDDERVKILDSTDGGSATRARNEGLLHAVGQYILFADSDDVLASGAIETLVTAAEKQNADIVCGGWTYIDKDGKIGASQLYENAVYTGKRRADRFDMPGVPWAKLYRRELFESIRFPSGYTCFEDAVIHFLVFRSAERIASVRQNVYFWRKNADGLTASSQHTPAALQSVWILEELIRQNDRLGLEKDELFAYSLILQLDNFCYVDVAGFDTELKKQVFCFCQLLYDRYLSDFDGRHAPYPVKLAAKAFKCKRFDLWVKEGKYFQLIR